MNTIPLKVFPPPHMTNATIVASQPDRAGPTRFVAPPYGERTTPSTGGPTANQRHRSEERYVTRSRPKGRPSWWPKDKAKQVLAVGLGIFAATGISVGAGVTTVQRRKAQNNAGPKSFNTTFNSIDPNLWTVYDGSRNNGAYACGFTKNAVAVKDGSLYMSIIAGNYSDRAYGCAQMASPQNFTFGIFETRMQASAQPGVVSAMFTYMETQAEKNQEIDIEITGANTSVLWVTDYRNAIVNTSTIPLAFDASASAHVYRFEWRKNFIAWAVDGKEVHRRTGNLPLAAPTKLFMNTWLRQSSAFGGVYDPSVPIAPTSCRYDWVAFTP